MEPYDFRLEQITFNENQLNDGGLDSFSNVIHYDSALIDKNTGKKTASENISKSAQFAWSGKKNIAARSQKGFVSTVTQFPATEPSHASSPIESSSYCMINDQRPDNFALEINKLIKDIYSDVQVPFSPLREKNIADWIVLRDTSVVQDQNTESRLEKFIAQPSRVKVTNVYNQSVWSEVLSHPSHNNQYLTNPDTCIKSSSSDSRTGASDRTESSNSSTEASDIRTLFQVSANTTAIKDHHRNTCNRQHYIKMAELSRMSGDTRAEHGTMVDNAKMAEHGQMLNSAKISQPFESVAEALHLQQSVIGNRVGITPAPPEVVAQIVAEAERKFKLTRTTVSTSLESASTTQVTSLYASIDETIDSAHSLPPKIQMPDPHTAKELIRMHGLEISHSSAGSQISEGNRQASHIYPSHSELPPASFENQNNNAFSAPDNVSNSYNLFSSPIIQPLSQRVSPSDLTSNDNNSVESSNSELETFSENATERFLNSLPPFRAVNLKDLIPDVVYKPMVSHSPPVKETSFRPVAKAIIGEEMFPPLIAEDRGVFPSETNVVLSTQLTRKHKENAFVMKPLPLFQSIERKVNKSKEDHLDTVLSQKAEHSYNDINVHLEEVRKEKAKLEGQLEMLNTEAQATLQERAELQAQVASLKLKLLSQKSHKTDAEKDLMKADFESLKQLRKSLEMSLSDLQQQLEEKSEEGRNLQEDLNQTQEQCHRLNLKMKEMKDDVKSKEMTIQALKNKVAELYVEVQTSMQTKMEADNDARSARSDLESLKSTKEWYQQQLEVAYKAKSELQKEMTHLQAQAVSQASIIERLKTENTKLRQQYTEIQNKALKEKELLAKHLERIESDMMDREAAFQEIQRERSFLEDTFNTKIQSVEDEKSRISLLMQMTNDLENQLDRAHNDLKKKQNQIVQLENENIELMKRLNLSQENVVEKETALEELRHNLIELEAKLNGFQHSIVGKDAEIMMLKEDKAKIEIQLNAALHEKSSVDKVLDGLKSDMGKVESSFKTMKQELNVKSSEMHQINLKSKSTEEQVEHLNQQLENERRMFTVAKSDLETKTEQINELQSHKINLESEVTILREKLSVLASSFEEAMKEKQCLDSELNITREKFDEVRTKLEEDHKIECEDRQKFIEEFEEFHKVQEECSLLKVKMAEQEKESKKDILKQKAKYAKLNQDLNAVKQELIERQKTFDESIEVLGGKLRELVAEKDKLETELTMVHRKYELSMLEQKDQIGTEMQNLASELQQLCLEKQNLESQYIELQHARDLDLQKYQQQLSALEDELQEARKTHHENFVSAEIYQELMLELEKEKGRVAGLMQSNSTLKHHVSQLENALASRESTLTELQTHLHQTLKDKEHESQESMKRVQALEDSLQKEKEGQRDIRKQIGQKITENNKLRRQNENLKQDQDQLRQDVAQREQEVSMLHMELDTSKQEVLSKQATVLAMESETNAITRELVHVQQQLQDNLSRQPVIQGEMKSLQWQLELKSSELEASQQQLKLSEERQAIEIGTVRQLLHEKNNEIEALKLDVTAMKHDKQNQQSKISELRSALKSSIQYHKLLQMMGNLHYENGSVESSNPKLPPLPFDLEDMDKLLQETTVRALESKPLDNLQNCLVNLRSEISGLQTQMDIHNNEIQTSTHTWSTLEHHIQQLCTVVQTITNSTTTATSVTNSLASAAVEIADKSLKVIDV